MTGSGAAGQIRRDIGDLSREIAAFAPDRVGKQFETRRLQCAAGFDAGTLATTAANGLLISDAADLYFYPVPPLTRA